MLPSWGVGVGGRVGIGVGVGPVGSVAVGVGVDGLLETDTLTLCTVS